MTFEQQAYELPEIWENAWFSPDDHARFRTIEAIIPGDAKTLVDVGCGNGLFVNGLRASGSTRFARIAAVDRSAAALAHVRVTRCQSQINALPFRDASFDIATAMEVVEHLPVAVFPAAIAELARVARKYVVVSVPYRQDLAEGMSRCPKCETRFNPDFHMRSFDEATMRGLLDGLGYRHVTSQLLGATTTYVDRALRARFWAWLRPRHDMPAYAICPVCGWHDAGSLRSELARRATPPPSAAAPIAADGGWLSRVRPSVTTHRWICALYAR